MTPFSSCTRPVTSAPRRPVTLSSSIQPLKDALDMLLEQGEAIGVAGSGNQLISSRTWP